MKRNFSLPLISLLFMICTFTSAAPPCQGTVDVLRECEKYINGGPHQNQPSRGCCAEYKEVFGRVMAPPPFFSPCECLLAAAAGLPAVPRAKIRALPGKCGYGRDCR